MGAALDTRTPATIRRVGRERARREVTYCIVPHDLAPKLHELLRDHFRGDEAVEVVVELRAGERRRGDRRAERAAAVEEERRRVLADEGRRIDQRRLPVVDVPPPELPKQALRHAASVRFVRRAEPTEHKAHDAENARLVARFQAGDEGAFAELYMRNFGQVYSYARIALREHHEAEDVTQQVFLKVMGALPRFTLRSGTPFRAWLFRIARNETISHLRKHGRLEVEDPEALDRRRIPQASQQTMPSLDWISDSDLLLFIERLPQLQRQAIALRFMLGLTTEEMSEVLDRTPVAIRKLEHRALRFLEARLMAMREHREKVDHNAMRMRARRSPVTNARRMALAENSRRR
jgi:RNA polymerase sigma-70 factor (ECF subfamily)